MFTDSLCCQLHAASKIIQWVHVRHYISKSLNFILISISCWEFLIILTSGSSWGCLSLENCPHIYRVCFLYFVVSEIEPRDTAHARRVLYHWATLRSLSRFSYQLNFNFVLDIINIRLYGMGSFYNTSENTEGLADMLTTDTLWFFFCLFVCFFLVCFVFNWQCLPSQFSSLVSLSCAGFHLYHAWNSRVKLRLVWDFL